MNWWHYLLLVNIYLVLFYGFYALLLRKETFFQLNRVYLVSAVLLSFLIPMIQSTWVKDLFITRQMRYTIYGGYTANVINYKINPIQETPLTVGQLFTILYFTGIVFLTLRFLWQLVRLMRIVNQPEPTAAYSFFSKISIGKNHAQKSSIMAHEQVHARQWHSIDVLIIEALMIINWFNPVVYFYRFAIKHIHEFIADQQALKTGADKAEYARLLLSQTFNVPTHQLANPFYNHSLLKQRIIMIQKNKSQRVLLFKYVLSAPLFGLMLVLSSATVNNSVAVKAITKKADKLFVKQATLTVNGINNNGEIPANTVPNETKKQTVTYPNNNADTIKKDPIYVAVSKPPVFVEGDPQAFSKFLAKTIKYPAQAHESNVSGQVFIQFVVEKDGSLSDIKAIRGPGHGLDEEAVRAVKLSPKWQPGSQNGIAVRVQYTVPVNFSLGVVNISRRPGEAMLKPGSTDIYESVETEPQYPGGMAQFYNYLGKNITYPAEDRKNNITGKVFIQFVVEKDGSLTNVVALRGPSEGLKQESVRVISLSPKWIPGTQGGNAVRVEYTVPVNFTLDGSHDDSQQDKVYESVEHEPDFPGGMQEFYQFLAKEIRYPADARRDNITGKVFVQFIVERDGSITNVKALRGPGHGIDEEAVRAVSNSPKWQPGIQNGRNVRVFYTIPVNFTLTKK